MVGGNGQQRTLGMAARFADIWNGVFLSPADYRARSERLGELLRAGGREPDAVKRTMMTALFFGRDLDELDRRLAFRHEEEGFVGLSLAQTVARLREGDRRIVGTPAEVIEQLRAYAAAGVQEMYLQWFDLDDLDGLQAFADNVLPHVRTL
jgi:alkanesulfonate monooxygenase SsuD/methylene tetrahydromethanopterin reductase-like flavin-dependent oxidoreductase (luciferase family)